MYNPILNTPSLTKFIEDTPMEEGHRKELFVDLPYMDRTQRIELLRTLLVVQELEQEKKQVIQKIGGHSNAQGSSVA